MAKPDVSLNLIEQFLRQKRIAMVGVSRDEKDFSIMLFKELCRRGYDMVPVNPHATEIQGRKCFARLQDVQPAVGAVLLMTSPAVTNEAVRDCAAAGIRFVWMYRAGGNGAVSAEAVSFCREHDIQVVPGECPFMFLPNNGFHRIHGWIVKLTGKFPQRKFAT